MLYYYVYYYVLSSLLLQATIVRRAIVACGVSLSNAAQTETTMW